ncbi:MAG: amidohydrolase family protein [Ilumatobacteraceae bacterium]
MDGELLIRGQIVTMDGTRRVISDGAVVAVEGRIEFVGDAGDAVNRHPSATVLGGPSSIVTPGLVNAHQHLTGDRLIRSCIPEDIDSDESIFLWAVPVHAEHTPDDDELTATLGAAEAVLNGVTTIIEAGTVAHVDRVAQALGMLGLRARVGRWGWDIDDAPHAAPTDEVLQLQREVLDLLPAGGLVESGVTLVGHDLMSDALVSGAADLARERGVGMTMHISPHRRDPQSYLDRVGVRPIVHFDRLGVLGRHLLLAHAVHLDAEEAELVVESGSAVASCPWAYLRLAQGFQANHRHDWIRSNGGRLALGTDSENAGDAIDILRTASLFVGLVRDRSEDHLSMTSADGFALATIDGAEAVGLGDTVGSLEVGKRADIVVHDANRLELTPLGTDPVRQLVWAADGRSVVDVVVDGRVVVRDGRVVTVDLEPFVDAAVERQQFMLSRVGRP